QVSLFPSAGKYEFQSEDGVSWKSKIDGFEPNSIAQALDKIAAVRITEFMGKSAIPSGNNEISEWMLKDKAGKSLSSFSLYGASEKGDYYAKLQTGELVKLERGSAAMIFSKL